jgi:hypothetical protein
MFLIDDLLGLPFRGLMGAFRRVAEAAETEYTDDGRVKEELLHARMLFETDQLSEAEYDRTETRLLQRLEDIRKYREQQ